MQRVVAGARQHRLLSLLQPWAADNASMRGFGTSGLKVQQTRTMLHDSPELTPGLGFARVHGRFRPHSGVQLSVL